METPPDRIERDKATHHSSSSHQGAAALPAAQSSRNKLNISHKDETGRSAAMYFEEGNQNKSTCDYQEQSHPSVENNTTRHLPPPMSVIVIQAADTPGSTPSSSRSQRHSSRSISQRGISGGNHSTPLQPPMSVSWSSNQSSGSAMAPPPPTLLSGGQQAFPFQQPSLYDGSTGTPPGSTTASMSSPFSGSFRLQPRQPIKCTPSPSTRGGSLSGGRGRKRSANSISSLPPEVFHLGASLTTNEESLSSNPPSNSSGPSSPQQPVENLNEISFAGTATTATTTTSSPATTPERPPKVDLAVSTLQGLTLHSPASASTNPKGRETPPPVPPRQRLQPPPTLDSATDASPQSMLGSQASVGRSSFSKYTPPSPATVDGGSTANRTSPSSLMSSSSPKLAPLTVLSHCSPGVNDPYQAAAKSPPSSFALGTTRPPLHAGVPMSLMHSLDAESEALVASPPEARRPPELVHCHLQMTPNSDSLGPHMGPNSAGLDSPASNSVLSNRSKRSRHSRDPSIDSTPSRRSNMSMSPTSTPLPRLTLTPRSAGSRRSQGSSLPTFPLEPSSETGGRTASAFTSPSSRPSLNAPSSGFARRERSYIPLPDWGEPSIPHMHSSPSSHPSFYLNQAMSLLAPPAPDDALEMFIGANAHDGDSLSASDDEETFFLATPGAIKEEKEAVSQQVKQRRLRKSDSARQSLASGASSAKESSASLRGMNFVTSCTSLDKEGSRFGKSSSSATLPMGNSSASNLRRQESQSSIGLPLEAANSSSNDEGESAGRDLVTPPAMARPRSPPPLSPRSNRDGSHDAGQCGKTDIYYHSAKTPPWLCAGEADVQAGLHAVTRLVPTTLGTDSSPPSLLQN